MQHANTCCSTALLLWRAGVSVDLLLQGVTCQVLGCLPCPGRCGCGPGRRAGSAAQPQVCACVCRQGTDSLGGKTSHRTASHNRLQQLPCSNFIIIQSRVEGNS